MRLERHATLFLPRRNESGESVARSHPVPRGQIVGAAYEGEPADGRVGRFGVEAEDGGAAIPHHLTTKRKGRCVYLL